MIRKIIHIDMDAFYASIEQRDNSKLRGKSVAVGHSGKRGVVAAASYEARRYGVRSAMASVTALRKCPKLLFVKARFDVYKTVSAQIMEIFRAYTDLVEPLSLDEAFLDVTENKKNMRSATHIAKEIKQRILDETNLTASAGVSYNKFLAKIASDYHKPNGLCVITPEKAEKFVEQLRVRKFFGVGKVTAKKMDALGIKTGFDLKQWKEADLVHHFGKAGTAYYHFARGIDNREVNAERIRKSLGAEETFAEDLYRLEDLHQELHLLTQEVHRRAKKRNFASKTVTLKVKYADFSIITRSKTVDYEVKTPEQLFVLGKELLSHVNDIAERKIRLLGLMLKKSDAEFSSSSNIPIQLSLEFKEWRD